MIICLILSIRCNIFNLIDLLMDQVVIQISQITARLYCNNKNYAQMVCVSQNCKQNGLICLQKQCLCRKKDHFDCQTIQLQSFIHKLWERRKQVKDKAKPLFQYIVKIYQEIIQRLSNDLNYVLQKQTTYGMNNIEAKFWKIIQSNQIQEITGELTKKVKDSIYQITNQNYLPLQKLMILCQKKKCQLQNLSDFLKHLSNPQTAPVLLFQSFITKDITTILSFFERPIKRFIPLYRASKNDFLVSKFHQKCDQKLNTLVLIQTEHNRIIGGFTPLPWSQGTLHKNTIDQSNKPFLFSITNRQKYPMISRQNTIYYDLKYGPIFGNRLSPDLYISDKANCNSNTGTMFPSAYNNGKYTKSQNSYHAFCGATKGYTFQIKEWEVFEVQFEN